MKHYLLLALLVSLLVPTAAVIAEGEQQPDLERASQHLRMQRVQMEIENERAEFEFKNEMRQLKLKEKRAQLQGKPKSSHHGGKGKCGGVMAIIFIVHILTAIWVYQDIKKRSNISGIWIVIALLTGLLGTLVYAVVRLGETPQKE